MTAQRVSFIPALSNADQLAVSQSRALALLNTAYEAAARPLLREYPEIERLSWGTQQTEATAYRAWLESGGEDTAPATPALCAILRGRNGASGTETLSELVTAVLARAEAFISWQEFTGVRQRGEWAINDAETPEAAMAVTWESLTT
jgi:hypothetical protein